MKYLKPSFKILTSCLIIFSLANCGQVQMSPGAQALQRITDGGKVEYQRPVCEVDIVDYFLDTHVLGYEFVSQTDVAFGFNILKNIFKVLDVSIFVKRAQLLLSMNLYKPMFPKRPLASAVERGFATTFKGGVNVDFYKVAVNASHYKETPILDLTQKALKATMQELMEQVTDKDEDWVGWVLDVPVSDEVIISAGSAAGIREKDEFEIFNIEHRWQGSPCQSDYLMGRKTTELPLAVGVVVQVNTEHSLLRIVPAKDSESVKQGAMIEILKLAGKNRSPLAKSLRFGSFESEKLLVQNKSEIDLKPIFLEQLKPLVLKSNLVLK